MVFQKVAKILADIIEIDYEDITPETELTIDNGIEAVNIAKLVIQCEKKFHITIHDENVHSFKCVHDIVEYIEKIQSEN
jgi:acyl carrier protein